MDSEQPMYVIISSALAFAALSCSDAPDVSARTAKFVYNHVKIKKALKDGFNIFISKSVLITSIVLHRPTKCVQVQAT